MGIFKQRSNAKSITQCEIERRRERVGDIERERQIGRQRDGRTDRRTDRQIERERQTDRQTETEREQVRDRQR